MFLIATLLSTPALAADPKIINGEEAEESDYPAAGAMLAEINFNGQTFVSLTCSSTLIAPDVVLLAAHCVDEYMLTYGFGTLDGVGWSRQADLTDFTEGGTSWPDDTVAAWDWVQHPDWDVDVASSSASPGVTDWSDLAILFLEDPVDEDFIYLLQEDELDTLEEGVDLVVVGWGQQVATDSPWDPPPEGSYGIKQMGLSHLAELGDTEFKVGEEVEDVRKCHGDSGGPSFLRLEDDSIRLVGVTSHAYDDTDCRETGGVDTRVDAFLDWIDEELRSRCEDGSRAWCDQEGLPVPPTPLEEVEPPVEEGRFAACGCSNTDGAALAWMLVLLPAMVLRRRI